MFIWYLYRNEYMSIPSPVASLFWNSITALRNHCTSVKSHFIFFVLVFKWKQLFNFSSLKYNSFKHFGNTNEAHIIPLLKRSCRNCFCIIKFVLKQNTIYAFYVGWNWIFECLDLKPRTVNTPHQLQCSYNLRLPITVYIHSQKYEAWNWISCERCAEFRKG